MLPKHPDQYSDPAELEAWVRHLVDEQVEEGPRLDYKESIPLNTPKEKREAAKDISSFANEVGGTIIYGIPEERRSDRTAIPKKPYGIDPIPGLGERLENIYVDSLAPRLPEYRIRKVPLTECPDKVVYVVWTPESWVGPHMVQGYDDNRYYKRGQLRAIPMNEYEIRAKYERGQRFRSAAYEFADSEQARFALKRRLENGDGYQTYFAVVPLVLGRNRIEFSEPRLQAWLRNHILFGGTGWVHSYYGVNSASGDGFKPQPMGTHSYAEIYRSGAATCVHRTPSYERNGAAYLSHRELIRLFDDFVRFCGAFMQQTTYFGPLLVRVELANATNFLLEPVSYPLPHQLGRAVSADGHLRFDLEESAPTLSSAPDDVDQRLAERLFQAFGVY